MRIAHGPRGEVVTLEHDACGRVVRRTVTRKGFRPQTWVLEWNAQDQLIAADGPQGRWRYGYDPFGRRIFKESGGRREVFLWDGDVLARSGDIDWFHEPDSFRPMARRQAGALFHIVNDHLGTPKEMFSEGGALAWSVDHDTWGTVRHVGSRPVERGDYWVETVAYEVSEARAEAVAQLCPIRFQGQWEDVESGLYYNRFRYYEPLAGQYVAPDPIGIFGGLRSLGYVKSSSKWTDRFGLSCDEVIKLFRAVMPDELADIKCCRAFRVPGGVAEGKYFSTSRTDAERYGAMATERFGDPPYTIVETSIAKCHLTDDMLAVVDGGIEAVVVPTDLMNKLSTPML